MTNKSEEASVKSKHQGHDNSNRVSEAIVVPQKKKGRKRKVLWKVSKCFVRHAMYHALGMPHMSVIDVASYLF